MENIDDRTFNADNPGRMNTNFILHQRMFIKKTLFEKDSLINDKESFWNSSGASTQNKRTCYSYQTGLELTLH